MYDRIVDNEYESRALATRQDALQPGLVNGEIGVMRG